MQGGAILRQREDQSGVVSFGCDGKEMAGGERFRVASKAEWVRYDKYLNK